ncbi:MAG: succinate--CoA ligase subunit beta, partial [Kiritimatiellales bacterium]|nr:succinate--CoA ligase subunit beta [Kiritimatiellales bacterium]
MKIHEFQAKALLKGYGIPIQDGVTIEDVEQAEAAVDQVSRELGAD